jgi:hypothetical protein
VNLIKLILVVVLAGMITARAEDLRVVGGKTVDVQPVHDWLAGDKKDERPLPHWKEIQIESVIALNGAAPRCRITVDRQSREILIRNVLKEVFDAFAEADKLNAEFKRLETYVKSERIRVRQLRAITPVEADADSPGGEQIRQTNLAIANLKTSEEELEAASQRSAAAQARVKTLGKDLAMFTGQKYAGLEVWDCGHKQR